MTFVSTPRYDNVSNELLATSVSKNFYELFPIKILVAKQGYCY